MPAAKIAISLDPGLLRALDQWVEDGRFPNRSRAIQEALRIADRRWRRDRLAEECAKADRAEEQAMAEEMWDGEILPWEDA